MLNNLSAFIKSRFYAMTYITSYYITSFLIENYVKYDNKFENIFSKIDIQQQIINIIYVGILGARIFYCLLDNKRKMSLYDMVAIWKGGQSYFGAYFFVILYVIFLCFYKNISILIFLDMTVLFVPIFNTLIRIGNHVNKEINGYINYLSLIESFLHGIVPGICIYYNYFYNYQIGILFWTYLHVYGLFRFLTEFLRNKEQKPLYNLYFPFFSVGLWQFFSLITVNPYFLLLYIDLQMKQKYYTKKIVNKIFLKFSLTHVFLILTILYMITNMNIIFWIGIFSNILDLICFDRIRTFKNGYSLSQIYIIIGVLFQIIGIALKNDFFFDYNYLIKSF
tara:strand:+ start:1043 stop:2050 length:1008 start_codon:yes stop_codon:yes gene_type:complete